MQADWLWYLQKSMFNKIMVTEVKAITALPLTTVKT